MKTLHMLLNMAKFDFSYAGFLSQTTAVFRDQLATDKAQDIPSSAIIFNFYHKFLLESYCCQRSMRVRQR